MLAWTVHENIGHECALAAVKLKEASPSAIAIAAYGLLSQAHRGQESTGLALFHQGEFIHQKKAQSPNSLLTPEFLHTLPKSSVVIGHTRYSTTGSSGALNAQPFVSEKLAIAHNGNFTGEFLSHVVLLDGEPTSDTYAFFKLIQEGAGDTTSNIIEVLKVAHGAHSIIYIDERGRLLASRDFLGMRPLLFGSLPGGVALASESTGLSKMGARLIGEIPRGTLVHVKPGALEILWTDPRSLENESAPCTFETPYFAHVGSISDAREPTVTNHAVRMELGERVALRAASEIDFTGYTVVPVPDSGRSYAEGVAKALGRFGCPVSELIHINRFAPRTFLESTRSKRNLAVKQKYEFDPRLKGSRVVLMDDSIVRGTTMRSLITALFEAGVKDLVLLVGIPPITHGCHWGIDFPNEDELVKGRFEQEARAELATHNPEWNEHFHLYYQSLEDYKEILPQGNKGCYFCVSGELPSGLFKDDLAKKDRFEQ